MFNRILWQYMLTNTQSFLINVFLGLPKTYIILSANICMLLDFFSIGPMIMKKYYCGESKMDKGNEYIDRVMKHKHALIFAGGIATAIIGKKILESKTVKETCTKGMATVLSAKKDAEECFQDMKEDAEEMVIDANADVKKEIYIEDEDDK